MRNLLTIIFLLGSIAAGAQTKVGYTNVELLLNYLPETAQVSKDLDNYENAENKRLESKQARYAELVEKYYDKSNVPGFSGSEEETNLITEITELEKEINTAQQNFEYEYAVKKSELMEPILTKLQAAINEVAEEGGYTYILNQTSGTNILYGMKKYDVTDEIAKKLGIQIPD